MRVVREAAPGWERFINNNRTGLRVREEKKEEERGKKR